MRIRPQNGLGDAVFAIPFVAAHVLCKVKVTVETKHGEVFKPFGEWVEIVPLTKDMTVKELRYRQYGDPYFSRYFPETAPTTFGAALMFARDLYGHYVGDHWPKDGLQLIDYAIYAPPRAAARHKNFQLPEYLFQCSPDVDYAKQMLPKDQVICYVGQDEKFNPEVAIPRGKSGPNFFNFIDSLTLWELFALISGARTVVSQISAITAIAGLFDVPTIYLKGRAETDEQHSRHVAGVQWRVK